MKTVESKNAAGTIKRETTPFFSKESDQHFFGSAQNEKSFFPSSKSRTSFIQAKLNIGLPNDHYEKEADSTADHVLQRPAEPVFRQTKPFSGDPVSPVVRQKFTSGDEGKKVQKLEEEEDPSAEVMKLQRKPIFESNAETPEDVQKKGESSGSQAASPAIESSLSSSKGSGNPLPEKIRHKMESAMGADFSDVRVHNDSDAAQISKDLNAQAFTQGNDIYFNSGKYDTTTKDGKHLLAHELTHTIQQGNGLHTSRIQRIVANPQAASGSTASPPPGPPYKLNKDELDPSASPKTLKIEKISLPNFKKRNSDKFKWPLVTLTGRPPATKQDPTWRNTVKDAGEANAKVAAFLSKIQKPQGSDIYFLKAKESEFRIFGTLKQLQEDAYVPRWTRLGKGGIHEVDHVVEMQLGGADQIDNYELLDATANNSAGPSIQGEKGRRVRATLEAFTKSGVPGVPDPKVILSDTTDYIISFTHIDNWNLDYSGDGKIYWTKKEIEDGKQLFQLRGMTAEEIAKSQGTQNELVLYVNERSGSPLRIALPFAGTINNWLPGIDLMSLTHIPTAADDANFGTARVQLRQDFSKNLKSNGAFDISFNKTPGLLNTGYMKFSKDQQALSGLLRFVGLSPLVIEEFRLDEKKGIVINGKIKTDLPLFKGAEIDLSVNGKDIRLSKTFSLGEVKSFPSPFKVTDISLSIFASTESGFGLSGNIDFEVKNLGNGSIKGLGATKEGFGLSGDFIVDKKTFEGNVHVGYVKKTNDENGKWSVEGNIGIKEGVIKGVKKASLKAAYKEAVFTVDGDAELSIPGIDKIKLHADFAENGDFTFVADVELKKLPGIKSGSAKVTVTSKGEAGLKLGLAGEAVPDLPNVPGLSDLKLTISYLDGVFELRAKVGYKKGRFDGTIEVGVTNKKVDEKGQPQGEAPEKGDVSVFGYGSLTVDIYKDIKGTVSIRLTPEKEVFIGGKIEAKELKPFGEGFNYDKEILAFPELEFPLAGIPGISVSAFIKGGVHFKFVWLPLVLKELSVDFKETNIKELDKASLEIIGSIGSSAHAEVYLFIQAGLKARVLVATLSGSLGGEAGLSVDAEAGGKVDATWDMDKGLKFKEITAFLDVTPKAIFRLTGQVSVDLDLWITSVNLYYHQWVLAEKQLDLSGITLKVEFPIRFKETGEVELPAYESMKIVKPDFSGDSGNKILDDAINGDAKKEEQKKKEELKIKIHDDLRSADNKDVTPTEYTEKMMDKYEKSLELQAFVKTTIEEECRKLEYEHFEEEKQILRNQNVPLNGKISLLNMFVVFHGYLLPTDVEAFKTELARLEEEKKIREANAVNIGATQDSNSEKVNDIPVPPNPPPSNNNDGSVRKKEMPGQDGRLDRNEKAPLQRNPGSDGEEEFISGKMEKEADAYKADDNFRENLNSSGGNGKLLPEEVREQMETGIGSDFSNVKIHDDAESHQLSKQINAQAFTKGNDIFFNAGRYDTTTKEGQHLLAHELAHVVQQEGDDGIEKVQPHPVAPTPVARKTEADIFGAGVLTGMTLTEFKTYTSQQADWFVEATLTTPDRNDLWRLLLKTRPGSPVLSGVGDLTVTELRGVTDIQWIDLNEYCNGCDSGSHTVRINPSGSLADRIALGSTLRSIEAVIPGIVLEYTLTETQLKRVQTEGLLVPVMSYFTLFNPHLQETVGSAAGLTGGIKSETQLLLDFIKAPGMLPFISLLGRVRNLHRFAPDALTQLMSNFADFSHTKPVYLILYSGHDYNSAFIRSQSLFENLIKDRSKLVLMLEGQGSIQDIIDKVPLITKTYGQPDAGKINRIAQVMIAGHGSSRSVEMAGTGAPTINAQGEVIYTTESLDLDNNTANSVKLLEVLMDNMNPATARIVYAGCLVGSKEVPVNDPKGVALTGADITKEVNDPAKKSLAAFTRDLATSKGKGGMEVEGARASVALSDSKSLQDAAGNLHVDYTFDPTSFGNANIYVATGREPDGLMRSAVELAAVNPVVAANQLRLRQAVPAKDPWYDPVTLIFVKAALDGVPPGGGADIVKLNQLASMAPHFLLSYWASRSIAFFGANVNVNPPMANNLYTDVLAIPAMSAPGDIKVKQGRFVLELAWCMMNGARSANVITYLDGSADLTTEILEQQLDIPWLNAAVSSTVLFPAGAAPTDGRVRLAIAWLNKDNNNADVKAFLDGQVNVAGPRPRLQPAVIAQLSNPADEDNILMILGRLAPMVPPKAGGPALPAANADAFPNFKGPAMNDIRIEPNIYTAIVIPPAYVLNVRTLPSMAGLPFHWLKRGESVNVMGFVHNWAAVDINGRLGFAHKNFLSVPKV